MAANPRIVTEDRHILWDGVTQRVPKGQQIDVPPGSALERAIGAQFLIPLPGTAPEPVPQEEPAPVRPAAPVRKQASAKDGAS